MSAILTAEGLSLGYHGAPVVTDFNLTVEPGEIVTILGANGAGKTTTMLGLAGAIRPTAGSVTFDGEAGASLLRNAKRGLGVVTDDRSIFRDLTARENLRLGRGSVDSAVDVFPALGPLLNRRAGLLSGGEQQMLGLARVIASKPKIILTDELSLGLAPIIVTRLLAAIRALADQGSAVVLVEQHVRLVLEIADKAVVLRRGAIEFIGSAAELKDDDSRVARAYLSSASEGELHEGAPPTDPLPTTP
jgi:branched-chain amino acid transport system ATP-binding protein